MKRLKLLLLSLTVVLSGCVVGTRNVDVSAPAFETDKTASGSVYLGEILDKRVFEQAPSDPSTPSVDGQLSSTSPETLATLIGRQRNGFGKAMGDVALPEGGTVDQEVRDLITLGLESRGYQVVDDANVRPRISVDVEKFWAWFTPGMWAISFESNLLCKVNVETENGTQTFKVSGYGLNKGQVASDANWQLAYERAFADFLKNMDNMMDAKGL
ncbi:YajG family lipoprotein [Aestuariicella sp. G3-2]|uniref:YajG family lipoprotein n=1 Tax=Pseudomaricurvus albidus TaxID=2842452 RepID=UPI001C0D38A8|nr:YajG family lipoprotein [Aestuariicella albida]